MAFPLWLGILADGRTNIPPKTFVSRKLRLLFPPSLPRPLSKEPQRAGISAHVLRAYDRERVSDVPWLPGMFFCLSSLAKSPQARCTRYEWRSRFFLQDPPPAGWVRRAREKAREGKQRRSKGKLTIPYVYVEYYVDFCVLSEGWSLEAERIGFFGVI